MKFVYRPARGEAERDEPFRRMAAEGLLGCAMYAFAAPNLGDWRAVTARGLLLRCEDAGGRLLGCGLFSPWRGNLLEFDFTAFRESARLAPRMARGAFAWIFRHLACAGIVGICPLPNRHAWRLAEACGFRVLGRLPGACFYARKGRYVDGVLVTLARGDDNQPPGMPREALSPGGATQEFAMGFGGGMSTPSVPEVAPAPKQEVAKPVTEAATAARQNQRDKAAKAAGIGGSIYTSPLGRARGDERKTLLGQ
ncbi:GNAT family protein [uncultured Desulfovibrio sp.]|uniref:GNAT family N-acetyltransferase n=1 Tax=uncultured Desulfovibrio sp. TaxID=167968 RepID=UPI0028058FCE|nr:GNAT family protein [uncultured Desulfovibrio sp.]